MPKSICHKHLSNPATRPNQPKPRKDDPMRIYHRLMRGYYSIMLSSLVDSKQNELMYLKLFTKYRYHRERVDRLKV